MAIRRKSTNPFDNEEETSTRSNPFDDDDIPRSNQKNYIEPVKLNVSKNPFEDDDDEPQITISKTKNKLSINPVPIKLKPPIVETAFIDPNSRVTRIPAGLPPKVAPKIPTMQTETNSNVFQSSQPIIDPTPSNINLNVTNYSVNPSLNSFSESSKFTKKLPNNIIQPEIDIQFNPLFPNEK